MCVLLHTDTISTSDLIQRIQVGSPVAWAVQLALQVPVDLTERARSLDRTLVRRSLSARLTPSELSVCFAELPNVIAELGAGKSHSGKPRRGYRSKTIRYCMHGAVV
jgi:hypothetical protein